MTLTPPRIGTEGLRRSVGRKVRDVNCNEGFLDRNYNIATKRGKVVSRVYQGCELSIEVNHQSRPYFRRYQAHFQIETDGVFA